MPNGMRAAPLRLRLKSFPSENEDGGRQNPSSQRRDQRWRNFHQHDVSASQRWQPSLWVQQIGSAKGRTKGSRRGTTSIASVSQLSCVQRRGRDAAYNGSYS
ncbi:Translation initiation factor IF-2 [Sesbania bispinosa]|nr:Translation initiation factor IF-2 [Sesbania bispinosa]